MPLRMEHIGELADAGTHAWNEWAEKLIAEKEDLCRSGAWELAHSDETFVLKGGNEQTNDWLRRAKIDAKNYNFLDNLKLADCIIPGEFDIRGAKATGLDCVGTIFHGPVRAEGASLTRASFAAAEFKHRVGCQGTAFSETVDFSNAIFHDWAWFQGARFDRSTFWQTEFKDRAQFNTAEFKEYANIEWAKFRGVASFQGAIFRGFVKFLTTEMRVAAFDGAIFSEGADFRDVSCREMLLTKTQSSGVLDFRRLTITDAFSMRSSKSDEPPDFSGAYFGAPPDFTFTTFRRDFRLDNVTVRRSLLGFYTRPQTGYDATSGPTPRLGFYIDESAPAKFRELRRIASSSNDTLREMAFHANEIRSSRFLTDWPIPWPRKPLSGIERFWAGLIYGGFSNFGLSIVRPFFWWLTLMFVSAGLYLSHHPAVRARIQATSEGRGAGATLAVVYEAYVAGQRCVSPVTPASAAETNAVTEALQLAASNATVFGDSGADTNRRAFGCLYGFENTTTGTPIPSVPSAVSWIARFQRMLSAVFLFLFGLGLRNILRMR